MFHYVEMSDDEAASGAALKRAVNGWQISSVLSDGDSSGNIPGQMSENVEC